MKFHSYNQLKQELDRLLGSEQYRDATNLLENAQKLLSEKEYRENYFPIEFSKARYYIDCQMYEESMGILTCLIKEGYICPLDWQRFEPLKQGTGYVWLEEKNNLLREIKQQAAKFTYKIYTPERYSSDKKYPIFFILHGDGGNIKELIQNWKPDLLLESGFVVVYPQSSQILYHDNFGWLKNPPTAREEIKNCWGLINEQYSIDEGSVLVGGFSGGGVTALDITLTNVIPSRGFVSLCPVLKPDTFNNKNVELAAKRGVKGVFLEGEKEIPVAVEDEMIGTFKQAGLPFKYIINEGIGHWFPKDLDQKLQEAVKFILG